MSTIQDLRKSLVRSWRPVCSLVRVPSLRLSLPLSPLPLPPAFSGGWASPRQPALLLNCSIPLFCGRPAEWIFSLSLAIPQFKLVSHISSLWLPSGHSGPVLTLSNAACSSPFCPHLLVADVGLWGTFLLGVAFRHVICEFYLFFLPVRLPSEIRKLSPDTLVRGFPGVWKLPLLRLPSWDGSPSLSLLSLFIVYILSYLLLKTKGCFSGPLTSSASDQKLFCDVCSAFKCSFSEFLGEKVVSPSYSSAILALLGLISLSSRGSLVLCFLP